ncbi:PAS domain-containing hybrid sensor histidine kinase/response regulator [Desulfovibrio inopinatus]|uniref:PAS domain-containing hybrid sensor histidine kinase/response regulator n=1 Tax=Desulfovibrio inopinatus TaxID=102109 RepID=UPI00146F9D76|nr:PAS domain-containing hybrid sensor histidine kinase/response regulator [Desulfovibrio inopinatus]
MNRHTLEELTQLTAQNCETLFSSAEESVQFLAMKTAMSLDAASSPFLAVPPVSLTQSPRDDFLTGETSSSVSVLVWEKSRLDATRLRTIHATSVVDSLLEGAVAQSNTVQAAWIIMQDGFMRSFPDSFFQTRISREDAQDIRTNIRYSAVTPDNDPKKSVVWTKVSRDPATNSPSYAVCLPIYGAHGYYGSAGLDISIDSIMHGLNEQSDSPSAEPDQRFLLDNQGSILFMTKNLAQRLGLAMSTEESVEGIMHSGSLAMADNPDIREAVDSMRFTSLHYQELSAPGGALFMVTTILPSTGWIYGEVLEKQSANSVVDFFRSELTQVNTRFFRLAALAVFGLLLVLLVLCLFFFRRFFVRPLHAIIDAVAAIEAGRRSFGPVVSSRNEMGTLAREIDFMSEALDVERDRLHLARKKYRDSIENSPVGIFQAGLDGTLLTVNQTGAQILGYTDIAECLQDRVSMLDRLHDVEMVRKLRQTLITNGRIENVDLTIKGKYDLVAVRITGRLLQLDVNGQGVMEGMFEDISLQKQRERIEADLAKAEVINQARSSFLATMSHEIRTPLHSLLGSLDVLENTGLGEHQEDIVTIMRSSGSILTNIMNDLVDLSQLEKNEMDLDTAPFDLHRLVQETAQMFEAKAQSKALSFSVEIDPDLPAYRLGDERKLKQAFTNIVANALKFTESGQVRITVYNDEIIHGVALSVQDTGPGIAPQDHKYIFEDFTQTDSSTTRRFGGAGLGLAITNRLVRLMGGKINLESKKGSGAIFTIHVPLPLADQVVEETSLSVQDTKMYSGTVLIVDDFILGRNLVELYLEDTGLSLDMAETGDEAVEATKEKQYDLILMDIEMPGMDGFAAAACIREVEKQSGLPPVPIYALTAHPYDTYRYESVRVGLNGFLTKPMAREHLLAIIEKELSAKILNGMHKSRDERPDA